MLYLIYLFHILKYTYKTPSFEKLKLSVMTIWSCVIIFVVIKDKYLLIKLTPLLYIGSGLVFSVEASEYEAFF